MRCNFCAEYRKAVNSWLHDATHDWEYDHSNEIEVWDNEVQEDLDLQQEAKSLLELDVDQAISVLSQAHENGSTVAARQLGWHYLSGKHVDRDLPKAKHYYRTAWKRGSELAGLEYARSCRDDGDDEESNLALRQMIAAKFLPARYHLAWQLSKNERLHGTHESVLPHLRITAEQGHPSAMLWLGRLMAKGKLGLQHIPAGIRMLIRIFRSFRKHESTIKSD